MGGRIVASYPIRLLPGPEQLSLTWRTIQLGRHGLRELGDQRQMVKVGEARRAGSLRVPRNVRGRASSGVGTRMPNRPTALQGQADSRTDS